jgi:lipopolysaccharide transport system permease protein
MADFSSLSAAASAEPAPSGGGMGPGGGYQLYIRPQTTFSLDDLRELWRYRDLLLIMSLRDVSVRYKQAALGVTWALVQPLVQMVIFTLLFHRFAGIHSDQAVPYPVFCFSGLTVWMLFSSSLNYVSDSLVRSSNLITKVYFPRLIIPLASVLTALVDFALAFALLVPLMIYFHVPIGPGLVLALPIAALGAFYAIAIGLWTAALNVQFRDVRHALPFIIQLLVYLTPVFYPSSLIGKGRMALLLRLNPMAAVIDTYRGVLFGGEVPLGRLAISTVAMVFVGVGGLLWFRRMERTFADRV